MKQMSTTIEIERKRRTKIHIDYANSKDPIEQEHSGYVLADWIYRNCSPAFFAGMKQHIERMRYIERMRERE